jgi:iron-sulfur cluster assembly protein
MLHITATAAEQIKAGLATLDDDELMLRLAVRALGDGELEYAIGFDEPREQDERLATAAGITVLVSPPSAQAADETVIDYVEIEPGDMRFIFYRAGDLPDEGAPPAGGG